MSKIETIYQWRCPKCGRIFTHSDKAQLEQEKRLHEQVDKRGYTKYEYTGEPPRIFFSGQP